MKLFKILSHPVTLVVCFLLIMISGEHVGGFYGMYILMGLPFGAVHALLAIAGIIILLVNQAFQLSRTSYLRQVINFIAVLFLFSSLYFFFHNDKQHYNYGTFEQTIPIITMAVTAFVAICFLIGNFSKVVPKTMVVV